MRISFVFPPFYLQSLYNLPPLGIIHLATILKAGGHDCLVHDFVLDIRRGVLPMGPEIYRRCARAILDGDPEATAFSAQCTTYPALVGIARELKKQKPDLPVIVGGHHASFVDEATLNRIPEIDLVVRGEGERTVLELAQALEGGLDPDILARVNGLTFRGADSAVVRTPERALIENLDDLPLEDYSFVPSLDVYRQACGTNRNIAILEVGRGCPHACVYCSESAFWRRKVRTYSVERLIAQMKHLRDRQGADCFVLSFDQFTANKQFVRKFCGRILEEGLNRGLSWYCISRLDTVDNELLGLMRQAGLESMCYGIDSGSAKTLSFINKKIDRALLPVRVAETTGHGIVPTLSFIIGFPEEDREDIDATLELALTSAVQGHVSPLLQMPTVLGGTELHRRYARDLVREVDTYFALGLEFDRGKRLAADEELIDSDPFLFSSFFNLGCAGISLGELGRLTREFPLLLNLYPKSFLMLIKATGGSASLMFQDFLSHVAGGTDHATASLTPAACFQYFEGFVEEILDRAGMPPQAWNHLKEMARYETLGLEVAAPSPSGPPRISLKGPSLRPNLIVRELACDIPRIIEDMRRDHWPGTYPRESVVLAFHHQDGQLEVVRINEFGRQFLNLCDGDHTVADIAASLQPFFGDGSSQDLVSRACEEAAETFRELRFVETEAITR